MSIEALDAYRKRYIVIVYWKNGKKDIHRKVPLIDARLMVDIYTKDNKVLRAEIDYDD